MLAQQERGYLMYSTETRDKICQKRVDTWNPTVKSISSWEGIEYIQNQLQVGNSVIAGVSYKYPTGNSNPYTSHFVNIVGMGFEIIGNNPTNYFIYYETGRNKPNEVKDFDRNKLYENSSSNGPVYMSKSKPYIGKAYILTEVRHNIKRK